MSLFTNVFITAATLVATLTANPRFVYNVTLGEKQEIASQHVYKVDASGRYLQQHLKYNFTYDSLQRVTEKEVLKWDSQTQEWKQSFRLTFHYNDTENSVELSKWNRKTGAYDTASEKTLYNLNIMSMPEGYENYIMNESSQEWSLALTHPILVTNKNLLTDQFK